MRKRDSRWVRQALEGSEEAFGRLLENYQRPVFSIIVRMVRDSALAEDLTQETFVKAFRSLSSFDQQRKFSSWLFTIAHNTTIDHLRRKSLPTIALDASANEEESGDLGFLAVDSGPTPEERTSHHELGRDLEQALVGLRPDYAEILVLRFQEELSYEEISEVTGLPLGTVKTHLHRGRKALAKALRRRGWDAGAGR